MTDPLPNPLVPFFAPMDFRWPMDLMQFQLDRSLMLANWTVALWALNSQQWQRFAAMLGGGAPLDA
jgi:hypothetical protein